MQKRARKRQVPQVILGLAGKAGSGKSRIATHLRDHHGFVILPFAGPLKRMLSALGVPDENLYGQSKNEPLKLLCGKSARFAAQRLGTEWGRELIGANVWVEAWKQEAAKHERIVADDVRFPNETAAIARLGGVTLEIVRPGLTPIEESSHASEADLQEDFIDQRIVNRDGKFYDTISLVEEIIEESIWAV